MTTPQKKVNHVSNIAELRKSTGLTQQELAALVGVTIQTVQNWESGKSGTEQIEKFIKLCTVLGCDLFDLIALDPETEKQSAFSIENLRDLRKKWNDGGVLKKSPAN
jgi:transcriptional regulator with XRE-family HTH domain